ncbi:MAG TPA: hypothetical protein VJ892_01895 [Candidatus Absconditabacterales bacterium]|nr:hypothetical protein [Candidatus Absconditabacterales bacterium]
MKKQNLKNFLISFLITTIFSILIFFLVKFYDQSGNAIIRIQQNLYYIIFLFISIIISLTLFGNNNKKGNLIIASLILINFLYIAFIFSVGNIGLTNNQGYILIGLLILAFIGIYIKNRIGKTITTTSLIGLFGVFVFSFVPLYQNGPDIEGFNNSLKTKLLTYSKVNLNGSKVFVEIDKKIFPINSNFSLFDIKINNSGSQLLFKSNEKYKNTFAYIVFPQKEFIQIYPQSAINIDKNYNIEIITGMIKYFPQKHEKFSFTGKIIPSLLVNEEELENINIYFETLLKKYISKQMLEENLIQNKKLFKISEYILKILSKVMPNKFKNNLENLNKYKEYLDLDYQENYKTGFDNKEIKKDFLKNLKDGFNSTKTIK